MQQAELLSSLAQKVNADNTDQSMENAWKVNYSAVLPWSSTHFSHYTLKLLTGNITTPLQDSLVSFQVTELLLLLLFYMVQVLQDFFNKSKENDLFRYGLPDIDFQLEEFKDLVDDLRSSNEDSQASWRFWSHTSYDCGVIQKWFLTF